MTADEDGLEALLRARYLTEMRKQLNAFATALGFNQTESLDHFDGLARLFVRFDSFPAFGAWRTDVLRAELAETQRPEPNLASASSRQAEPRLRAVQILGGERTTKEEWDRLVKAFPGRRLKGLDHKWNLTEAELMEALR